MYKNLYSKCSIVSQVGNDSLLGINGYNINILLNGVKIK